MNHPGNAATPLEDRPTRVRYGVLLFLCSMSFLTYLDRICITRVQNDVARDLRLDALTQADEAELLRQGKADDEAARADVARKRATLRMGWVFSAFLWGYNLFEIPAGWLGDIYGTRRIITRIVVWWSVFTALTGSVDTVVGWFVSSPTPWLLLAALLIVRFLFGAGEAGAFPNMSRVVSRWFPYRARGTAQGAIMLSSRLGGAFAPLIIGRLIEWLGGWREAFWTLGALGIGWAVAFYYWFRDRPEDKSTVNAAECRHIRAGAGSGAGSIYDDAGHVPLPWRRLLFSVHFWALYLAGGTVGFAWYFNVTFFPKFLEDRFGVSLKDSEIMAGMPLLVGAVTCVLGGRLSDWLIVRTGSKRWGRSLPPMLGFIGAGVCTLLAPHGTSAREATALLCLAAALQDIAVPLVWAVCADVGGRYAGTLGGAMNTVANLCGAVSVVVYAHVANLSSDANRWDNVFLLNGSVYLVGSLVWLLINAERRLTDAEPK